MSSLAGEVSGPLQAVYYASKAYVTSLSNALWRETEGTGVTVTALLPGATHTGFTQRARIESAKLFRRMARPHDVAKAGFEGMLRGKLNVVAGVSLVQRVSLRLASLLPRKWVMNQVYNMQKVEEERER